jgi:hypothetical protein
MCLYDPYSDKTAGRCAPSPNPLVPLVFLFPNSLQDLAESESASGYQRGIQRPYAASAADASDFLLVSLSKMPRLNAYASLKLLAPRHFR